MCQWTGGRDWLPHLEWERSHFEVAPSIIQRGSSDPERQKKGIFITRCLQNTQQFPATPTTAADSHRQWWISSLVEIHDPKGGYYYFWPNSQRLTAHCTQQLGPLFCLVRQPGAGRARLFPGPSSRGIHLPAEEVSPGEPPLSGVTAPASSPHFLLGIREHGDSPTVELRGTGQDLGSSSTSGLTH